MNWFLHIVSIIVIQFITNSVCSKMQNNVCLTYKDYYTIKNNSNCWYDFSADSNAVEIISKHGYPVEVHKVITLDGYILTVFRIPNYYSKTPRREPVFLQHGWMSSAAFFVAHGKESLAFELADNGYDVWLGNFRGTEYSEEHVNLTVHDNDYWDHSADEIGMHDIPAQLELISQATGERGNIIYIGHSLGTTSALIYSSTYPKAAKHTVKLFILLAPASNLSHMRSLLFRIFGPSFGFVLDIAKNEHFLRLISQAEPLKNIANLVCLESPELMKRCMQIINLMVSGPRTQTEPKTVPVLLKHLPAGSSFKVTKHIADLTRNYFGKYSYGLDNYKHYGTIFPHTYDVSKIKVPVFIMYAVNDWACTKADSLRLYDSLSSNVRYGIHEISEPNFNHLDFMFGRNAKQLVNDVVLKLLLGY
ncbi:hypothetical protein ILUMI_24122 [Ignelater luminosus]|uniref:Lipase n=1 Tax=Ignelater luminosus TaxID=2038154 RepID=A0A8K0C6U7_IGNLU|nr:hypothetical protein ILUMI_24122 [Ignelater luminosus]